MVTAYIDDLQQYLTSSDVINFTDNTIVNLAEDLYSKSKNTIDYIKNAYEYVRDQISHSADINHDKITCSASEVLAAGHGICFAKSHLLASLLRYESILAGFCYQKLILDDETAPVLIYRGLNGVYLSEYNKWIRLDARGNKEGVNAQFSVEEEQLAFPIRTELGEEDNLVVYSDPDECVLERLKKYETRTELFDNLPTELAYLSGSDVMI